MPYKSSQFQKHLLKAHQGLGTVLGATLVPPCAKPDGCILPSSSLTEFQFGAVAMCLAKTKHYTFLLTLKVAMTVVIRSKWEPLGGFILG